MKNWLRSYLAPKIGYGIIRAVAFTLRVEIEDRSGILDSESNSGCIFAFWHNRILLLPYFYRKQFPNRKVVVMISTSRDGQMIAKIVQQFDIEAARGSSSKKSLQVYRQTLRRLIEQGSDVGVSPDGPRGPKYQVQPGVLALAQMSGYPIVPITYHLEKKIELNSWDNFQIPIPFSKCKLVIGEKITIPQELDEHSFNELKNKLQDLLGI
jgi:lysophospholipid acyltransferase (LPLAT)-like uncharacterized protein